jgi:predicted RNase H-like HicB family nuclease
MKGRVFSLSRYLAEALKRAEYARDEHGIVIATVPSCSGFFAQGENFEEARDNLRDVIEGNVFLALQFVHNIPRMEGIRIEDLKSRRSPGNK